MGWIETAIGIAGVGAAVYGGVQESKANKQAADDAKKYAGLEADQILANAENQSKVNIYNADAAIKVADFNAKIHEENAAIYRLAGEDAISRGVYNAAEKRTEATQAIGRGRAVMGSSGFATDSVSAERIQVQNRQTGELNALTVMNSASRESLQYKIAANAERNQAKLTRYAGELEKTQTLMGNDVGLLNAKNAADVVRAGGQAQSDAYNSAAKGAIISGASKALSVASMFV